MKASVTTHASSYRMPSVAMCSVSSYLNLFFIANSILFVKLFIKCLFFWSIKMFSF